MYIHIRKWKTEGNLIRILLSTAGLLLKRLCFVRGKREGAQRKGGGEPRGIDCASIEFFLFFLLFDWATRGDQRHDTPFFFLAILVSYGSDERGIDLSSSSFFWIDWFDEDTERGIKGKGDQVGSRARHKTSRVRFCNRRAGEENGSGEPSLLVGKSS